MMNNRGRDHHHPELGISSRLIASANIPLAIAQVTKVGSMPMGIPTSTDCSEITKPMRWPAWRLSGASSWISLHLKATLLPRKRSADRRTLCRGAKTFGANLPTRVSRCGGHDQNRSLTIWKLGCIRDCPRCPASRLWLRPNATPLAGYQRRSHTLRTAPGIGQLHRRTRGQPFGNSAEKLDVRGLRRRRASNSNFIHPNRNHQA